MGFLVAACATAPSPASSTTPRPVATHQATSTSPAVHPRITAIAAGRVHTCALTSGGGVNCWGANQYGELGNGTKTRFGVRVPVDVSGLGTGVEAIAAGGSHTCALTSGGDVKCWGFNVVNDGGSAANTDSSVPVNISSLASGASAIAAGYGHTCALTSRGVQCWGDNFAYQLGNRSGTNSYVPVDVVGLDSGVSAVAAGSGHTCALSSGGEVTCWGENSFGQLGNGTTTVSSVPVAVADIPSGITAIAAGDNHTCALTSGGGVTCWGSNDFGQLGNGMTNHSATPVEVSGLADGVTTIVAAREHTCALTSAGGVTCWGSNGSGRLGHGTTTDTAVPGEVSGLASGVVAIAAGLAHTCALTSTGAIKCWGSNQDGQLGALSMTDSSVPVDIGFPNSSPAAP